MIRKNKHNDQRITMKTIIGLCFVLISTNLFSQNCSVNANVDFSICNGDSMILIGSKGGLFSNDSSTFWIQTGGPSVIIENPYNCISNVIGYLPNQTYSFTLISNCEDGTSISDDINISVLTATESMAGLDISTCPGTIFLEANECGLNETGSWSIIGQNNGITINSINSFNTSVNVLGTKSGVTNLRWTIQNTNGCSSTDDLLITNRGGVFPVSAGLNQVLSPCYSNSRTASLSATFGGSGIDGQRGYWTLIDGQTIPTIMIPDSNKTVVKELFEGTYLFLWTVEGPCGSGQSTVEIVVPPESDELSSASITNPAQNYCNQTSTIVLIGSIPSNPDEIVEWTQRTNLPATIENQNSPTTTISNLNGVGPYTFRYSITNQQTGCSTYKDAIIKYTTPPNINITSPLSMILPLDTTNAKITYTVSGGNATQFAIISTPNGVVDTPIYVASTSPQLIDSFNLQGQYILRFKRFTSAGIGSCEESVKDVIIYTSCSPSSSNAGTNQILACNVTNTTIVGNPTTSGNGYWSQISGPSTVIFFDSSQNVTDINNLTNGAYTFRWSINGGINSPTNFSNVTVYVASSPPTVANAGNNLDNICYNSTIQLNGNQTASNEFGHWQVSPDNGIEFSDISSPNTNVWGFTENTNYQFIWIIENACGISTDTMLLVTNYIAGNLNANAGPDQCLPSGTQSIVLNAIPANEGVSFWTQISGPTVVIDYANSHTTTVSNVSEGTYQFEWKIIHNECSLVSDTVTITISANSIFSNAGSDTSICGQTLNLNGNIPSIGNGTWHQLSGPNQATLNNIHDPNSVLSDLLDGEYLLEWKVNDGACESVADTVKIAVSLPHNNAYVGIDITICPPDTSINLNANMPLNAYGYWTLIDGANMLNFSNITSPNSTISGFRMGTYVLRWNIQGGINCPISHDDLTINYTPKADAGSNINICHRDAVTLIGNENSNGIWSLVNGNSNIVINPISPNTAIASTLDTGSYTFRYTISNGCTSSDDIIVKNYQMPSLPNAGINQNLCNETSVELISNIPEIGTGKWKYVGSSSGTFSPSVYSNNVNYAILSPGTHTFTWTITNGPCSVADRVYVNNYYTPDQSNAGNNQIVCGLTTSLNANNPQTGIGRWTVVSGPGTINISHPISPTPTISASTYGTYILRWSITNGVHYCPENISISDITIQFVNNAPIEPIAGNNQQICGLNNILFNANDVAPAIGYWQFISGPNNPTISDTSSQSAILSNITFGNYQYTWNAFYDGCKSSDTISITVIETPSISIAQNDVSLCLYSPLSLSANNPTIGVGKWTQVSGPNSSIILSQYSNHTQVTGIIPGNYIYKWSITNGSCPPQIDSVHVIVHDLPSNAVTCLDLQLCNTSTANISANNPSVGIGTWSFVSGPNIPTISNQHSPSNSIQGLTNGKYTFKWTITNEFCTEKFDTVKVTIYNAPTVSNAGTNKIICGLSANMTANNPIIGTGSWSLVSGPGTALFSQLNSPTSNITCSTYGTYTFRWSIKNGQNICPENISFSDVSVQFINKPTIDPNAGIDQQICEINDVTLSANNVSPSVGFWKFISGPNHPNNIDSLNQNISLSNLTYGNYTYTWNATYQGCQSSDTVHFTIYQTPSVSIAQENFEMCLDSTLSLSANNPQIGIGKWTQVNGPNSVSFANPFLNQTEVTNLIPGSYLFEWKITNGACSPKTDSVKIRIFDLPSISNAGSNQELCNANQFQLIGNNPSIGIGTWNLENGPNNPNIEIINSNTVNINNVEFGIYTFKWTITNGVCSNSSIVDILNKRKPQIHTNAISSCLTGSIITTTDSLVSQTFRLIDLNNTIIQTWTGVSNAYTFTNVPDGEYHVSINRNFCESFSNLISLTNIHYPISPDTIIADRTLICPNDNGTISFVANEGINDTLYWFKNDTNSIPFAIGTNLTITSPELTTRFFAATHNYCGFSNFKTILIEVSDFESPIGEISDHLFETSGGSCFIENVDIGIPIATDNCSNVSISSNQPDTYQTGEHDVIWSLVDESGNITTIHQTITVISRPIANNDTFYSFQNQTAFFEVINNDFDCDYNINLNSLNIILPPSHGIIETIPNSGIIKYTPHSNYNGTDFLSYEICDSTNLCSSAGVFINVVRPNNPPEIHDTTITIAMNSDSEFFIPIIDSFDSSPYNISNFNCFENGLAYATIQNQIIRIDYTPDMNFIGIDTICLSVCDSGGLCSSAIIVINIINTPPKSSIGISKFVSEPILKVHGDYQVRYSIIVKNMSESTLTEIQIIDSLTTTFPYPMSFNIINIGSSGNLLTNSNFDGFSDLNILNNHNSLAPNQSDTLFFDVLIIPNGQFGIFYNSAIASAMDSLNRYTFDISNNGLLIDSDSNNIANEAIDNIPTPLELKPFPQIGLALNLLSTQKMYDYAYRMEFLFTIENIGNFPLYNIQLSNNLNSTFENHEFEIYDFSIISGNFNKNIDFNGNNNILMLDTISTNTMNPGDISYIHFELLLKNQLNVKEYFKSTTISARGNNETYVYDISNDGFLVDPNHNGIANESSENIPTSILIGETSIWIPEGFSPNGDGMHDNFVLEGFGETKVGLKVYNRWGNIVYESSDYKNDWNGKTNQNIQNQNIDLPDGTYFYIICTNSCCKPIQGSLTIKR